MESVANAKNYPEKTLPFLLHNLPDVFLIKAEKELNETVERRKEGLREIREKVKTRKTLKGVDFHDDVLRLFLRHSKYDGNRTLKRLEMAIDLRRNYLIFKEDTDEIFAKIITAKLYSILPMRTKNGCIVWITHYGRWDPDQVPKHYFLKYAMLVLQQFLRDQVTQISGIVCIYDLQNMSFKIARQFTPSILCEAATAFLDCIPIRYKEVHIINQPSITKVIWSILKPLLNEKIRNRFIFHSSLEGLRDFIPITALPIEYEGLLKEEELNEPAMNNWMKKACDEQRQCTIGGPPNFY